MVSFSKLAELSSGNIGFTGGTAVDTMPHMGLTECADALTMYLYETTIADYEREEAHDDQLFEAAIEAISSGDSAILESAVSAINEAEDKGSVWERIKGVFKTCMTFWTISIVGFFVWSQMWASPMPSDNATITPVVYMYNAVFGTTGSTARDAGVGAAVGILMALIVLVVFGLVNVLVKDDDLEF